MPQTIIQKYGKRQKESHFYKKSTRAQLMIHDNFNNQCELNTVNREIFVMQEIFVRHRKNEN